jgi:amidase
MLWGVIPALMAREAVNIHGELLDRHGAALGGKLAELLEGGRKVSTAQYLSYVGVLDMARRAYDALVGEHPVIATPAALGPAPHGLLSTGSPRCNAPWTALGVPAVSLPFTSGGGGLPMGLQLTAARGRESLLLATAARFEQILRPRAAVIGSD